ncbi:hypothetical protein RFI_21513 [Reticulomyxa filosa]|uniref:ERAP1-like C-terminal domain-containing protein n=1 Tax=Reticulomyxa filosa TaxID=46433 RepID=X6MQZ0_RETFI|nr:hypothetical protein RFI_21513 [Reticulomyxa filosa]|eukprot:ETO15852.1 hypothetical protein RFI_21513 [Reticulomyxa filosa]
MMDSWILQPGFPLLRVHMTGRLSNQTVEFELSQQRMLMSDEHRNDMDIQAQLWSIPVLVQHAAGQTQPIIMTTASQQLNLVQQVNNGVEYYMFNPNMSGVYHVFYDNATLQLLQNSFTSLTALNQFTVLADRLALMLSGYISADSYLLFLYDVLQRVNTDLAINKVSYVFWRHIISALTTIDSMFCEYGSATLYSIQTDLWMANANNNDGSSSQSFVNADHSTLQNFRSFSRDLLAPVWELVNKWSSSTSDTDDITSLRPYLASALILFNDTQVIAEGYSIFVSNDLTAIDPNLIVPVLEAALTYTSATETTLQWIFTHFSNLNSENQLNALRALGAFCIISLFFFFFFFFIFFYIKHKMGNNKT